MIQNLPTLLIISLIPAGIEVDMSVPSFPDIANHFNVSDGWVQMTVAINFLGFCLSSLIYGSLSDFYGRRKVMVIGNTIMLFGAIGCAFAPTISLLLLVRFIQGIGASTSEVVVLAMIADRYKDGKAIKLIGIINSLLSLIIAAAPIIGSFINKAFGWQGNYIIVAIISGVSWLLLYLYLPETKKVFDKPDLTKIIVNYKTLLTDIKFIYASIIPSLSFAVYIGFITCGAFLYIETYQLSMINYALHQAAIIGIFALFSIYSYKISTLIGNKRSIILGIGLTFFSCIFLLLIALTRDKSAHLTTIAMMCFSIGCAVSSPVILVKSIEMYPNLKGAASSLVMSMRTLICFIVISLVSYIHNSTLLSLTKVLLISTIISVFCTIKLLKSNL